MILWMRTKLPINKCWWKEFRKKTPKELVWVLQPNIKIKQNVTLQMKIIHESNSRIDFFLGLEVKILLLEQQNYTSIWTNFCTSSRRMVDQMTYLHIETIKIIVNVKCSFILHIVLVETMIYLAENSVFNSP